MYNLLVLQYRGVSIFIPFISSHVDSVAFYVSCNMDRKRITRHSSTSASRVANHRGLELNSVSSNPTHDHESVDSFDEII